MTRSFKDPYTFESNPIESIYFRATSRLDRPSTVTSFYKTHMDEQSDDPFSKSLRYVPFKFEALHSLAGSGKPEKQQTVADSPGQARSPDIASHRARSVMEGKRHGNYPWVGKAREPLGHATEMGVSGGAVIMDGIGPSSLNLAGIGGIETIPLVDRWGLPLFVTLPDSEN